jgi:hypothetical protein
MEPKPAENDTTTRIRQGVTGHNVRVVLLVGTIGAAIGLTAAYFVFFG